jgi:hypothetical protein
VEVGAGSRQAGLVAETGLTAGAGSTVGFGAVGAAVAGAMLGFGGAEPLTFDQLLPSHAQSALETGAAVFDTAPADPDPAGCIAPPSTIPPNSKMRPDSGS